MLNKIFYKNKPIDPGCLSTRVNAGEETEDFCLVDVLKAEQKGGKDQITLS